MSGVIRDRLESYGAMSGVEEEDVLREITQEIVLAALGRTHFFRRVAFHGESCLRIVHGLNRFSGDLEFAMQTADPEFSLGTFLATVSRELTAYGYDLEIDDRSTSGSSPQQAVLTYEPLGKLAPRAFRPDSGPLQTPGIRLSVDRQPLQGATFETTVLDFPFPTAVCVFEPGSLFAGTLLALLGEESGGGRHWYDCLWFLTRGVAPNYALLSATRPETLDRLRKGVVTTNWEQTREEVRRFLRPRDLPFLDLWTEERMLSQCEKLRS